MSGGLEKEAERDDKDRPDSCWFGFFLELAFLQ